MYLLCAKHGPEADSTPPLPQGRRQVFKGGGGGGGAVRFRPDMKSGGGGGGGGVVLSALGPIRKAGEGVCVCAVHFRHNTKGGGVA